MKMTGELCASVAFEGASLRTTVRATGTVVPAVGVAAVVAVPVVVVQAAAVHLELVIDLDESFATLKV
jgi:hypothetical protein